uniref:Uncharacterized protein n=1 Tax=Candidatus Kentrum sp. FW TaxID=2126338 RepID=A0A450T878_9GAMM|nr:MAG: hypothetical protein BECKFW1821A_GA0114235_11371 [Candidatus Kentron sp. FW]VFJ70105.1 MAG: hypothetical protein BECKFW1821B_GA0114236_11791 [Candidatus Kentron sp. FW]
MAPSSKALGKLRFEVHSESMMRCRQADFCVFSDVKLPCRHIFRLTFSGAVPFL